MILLSPWGMQECEKTHLPMRESMKHEKIMIFHLKSTFSGNSASDFVIFLGFQKFGTFFLEGVRQYPENMLELYSFLVIPPKMGSIEEL